MKAREEENGVLEAEGDSITFRQGSHRWTVPVDSIAAIGEFTNESGPVLDDWFVCLITRSEVGWYQAPVYASGVQEVLEWLSTRLGEPIRPGLANSASFKSRVLWPPELSGKPLFEFLEPEPELWWQRILKVFRLWPWHNVQQVHAEVLGELRRRNL